MNNLSLIVDNQNLKRMVELLLEDIGKHCTDDCANKLPYALRYIPENTALAYIGIICDRCALGKYKKTESIRNDSSVELNLLNTYSKTVKIKKADPVTL